MPVAPPGPVEARLAQALHGGMQPDGITWNLPTTVRPAGRKAGETALTVSSVAAALLVKMVATAWPTAGAAMASTPGPVPMAMLASTVEVARVAALLSLAEPEQMEAFVGMPWAAVLAEMSSMVPLVQAARMATMGMLAPMVVTALLDARVWMVQMLVMVSMSSWATLASTGYILVSCSVALRFFERSTEIDRCCRADAAAQMSPEERRQCCRADAANAAAQMSPEERRQCCRADVAGGHLEYVGLFTSYILVPCSAALRFFEYADLFTSYILVTCSAALRFFDYAGLFARRRFASLSTRASSRATSWWRARRRFASSSTPASWRATSSCIDRKSIETVAQAQGIAEGFDYHEDHKQHKWDYMAFVFHLREKDEQDYTGPEQAIRNMMDGKDVQWLPLGHSKMLEADEDHAGTEDVLVRIDKKLTSMGRDWEARRIERQSLTRSVVASLPAEPAVMASWPR